MDSSPPYSLERRRIRANFERAVDSYDAVAVLQREVADRMLEQFEYVPLKPERILDVGAGTGYCTRRLESRFGKSSIIALDLAEGMLRKAQRQKRLFSKQRYLCADTAQLPLADQSVDLILSNFTLQWCSDLQSVLNEFRRVLRPGGLLTFSTLGRDTLKELRQSWRAVDDQVHVNHFLDLQEIGDRMVQSGFAETVTSVDRFQLSYPDVMSLMRDLKGLGATNVNQGRRRGLMGRSVLRQLEQAYHPFLDSSGQFPAAWEVVYGHGWAADEGFSTPRPFSLAVENITIPD